MFAKSVSNAGGHSPIGFLEASGAGLHKRDIGGAVLMCQMADACGLRLGDPATCACKNSRIFGCNIDKAAVYLAPARDEAIGRCAAAQVGMLTAPKYADFNKCGRIKKKFNALTSRELVLRMELIDFFLPPHRLTFAAITLQFLYRLFFHISDTFLSRNPVPKNGLCG